MFLQMIMNQYIAVCVRAYSCIDDYAKEV